MSSALPVMALAINALQTRKPTENLYPPEQQRDPIPLKLHCIDSTIQHEQILERVENAYIAHKIGKLGNHSDHLLKVVDKDKIPLLDELYSQFGSEVEERSEVWKQCRSISCVWISVHLIFGILHFWANAAVNSWTFSYEGAHQGTFLPWP